MTNVVGYPKYCSTFFYFIDTTILVQLSTTIMTMSVVAVSIRKNGYWGQKVSFVDSLYSLLNITLQNIKRTRVSFHHIWIVSVAILVLKEGSWYYKAQSYKVFWSPIWSSWLAFLMHTHADELAPVYWNCSIIRGYVSWIWGCRSQRCYGVDVRHFWVALELGCQAYSCLFLLILLQNIKLQKWHLNGSIRLYHICLLVLIDSGSELELINRMHKSNIWLLADLVEYHCICYTRRAPVIKVIKVTEV